MLGAVLERAGESERAVSCYTRALALVPTDAKTRIALGIAWLVVVAAEMIAATSGLGFLIVDARNAGNRYDLVVAGMVLIGLIGLLLDIMMRKLEHLSFLRWAHREE